MPQLAFLAAIVVALVQNPTLIWKPAPGNDRIEYVRQKMVGAGIPKETAYSLFSDPRVKVYPPTKIKKPSPLVDWRKLSANILNTTSLARGKTFMEEHRLAFEKAEKNFGVPKEVLGAILRVETNFGDFPGTYVVWNVFYSNLLRAPDEAWKKEVANLVHLAQYCVATETDCLSIRGSHAGAFGLPQFLPQSVTEWGVDGNGDDIVDLFDVEDAIASTANFLKAHGWEDNNARALARYYGSNAGYPRTVLLYADALKKATKKR